MDWYFLALIYFTLTEFEFRHQRNCDLFCSCFHQDLVDLYCSKKIWVCLIIYAWIHSNYTHSTWIWNKWRFVNLKYVNSDLFVCTFFYVHSSLTIHLKYRFMLRVSRIHVTQELHITGFFNILFFTCLILWDLVFFWCFYCYFLLNVLN